MDKMFFSILDAKVSKEFEWKKMKLNSFNETPSFGIIPTLHKWVQSATLKALATQRRKFF
jgi:hypothetical protein